tara:strand:- start:60 stop:1262 length:1203 start_codon:yes stop_codon:yes gene_type:complete
MTSVSYGSETAAAITKVTGLHLLDQSKFVKLLELVRDNVDQVRILYPLGSSSLNEEKFLQEYSNQNDTQQTYMVEVPINKIVFAPGQIRDIRPEYCAKNFINYKFTVDFQQSEWAVFLYDESTGNYQLAKKQHTTMQALAVAREKGIPTITGRVVSFASEVTEAERLIIASRIFYNEVRSINTTKEWEKLEHQVMLGEEHAIQTRGFYTSIPNLTWQPISHEFPLIPDAKYSITKVAEMRRLISWAVKDDMYKPLIDITRTLSENINWDKESDNKEISAYVVKAFYNFSTYLSPHIESKTAPSFDTPQFIIEYFSKPARRQQQLIGCTKDIKGAWLQALVLCGKINLHMTDNGVWDEPILHTKNKGFVKAVVNLCNKGRRKDNVVPEAIIKKHIKNYCSV